MLQGETVMRTRRRILLAVAVVVALTFIVVVPRVVAQQPGDAISFGVPQGTEITILGSEDPGDKLIFVGRASETTEGGTCVPGGTSQPIQSVVIVDPRPEGQRPTRRVQAVLFSPDTPVQPGTRVKDISSGGTCEIAGVTYDQYTGFVE
jgi:hypothetical protein